MRTETQNAWGDGTTAAGLLLGSNFSSVYGPALSIGGTATATFTTPTAVFAYLPAVGPANVLSGSVQNPVTTSAGEFGGEVLALQINVDFSADNLLASAIPLGDLRICNVATAAVVNGQTVDEFLAAANNLLGGGGAPFGPSLGTVVARLINGAFVGGVPSTFAQTNLVAGPSCGWSQGDMHTATQNSWGDPSSGAASLLAANFDGVFGASIVIGGTLTATFTDALAVFNYLPATGPAGPLTGNVQDPSTTSSGELGGEVLALQMNVDLSAASVLASTVSLGSLRICNFSLLPTLNGQTVDQFLATANNLLGSGGSAPFGPSSAAAVARLINGAFVGGAPSTFAQSSLVAGSCPPP
jgi:hypothetical protein